MSNHVGREASLLDAGSHLKSGGRHQVKRSLTDIATPMKTRGSQTPRHEHHLSQHLRSQRNNEQRETISTHSLSNRQSLDAPRPDVLSHSRRVSALGGAGDSDRSRVGTATPETKSSLKKLSQKEKVKAEYRIDGLKQSLVHLHTFSTSASQRLDQTYYAILEKTSALQNTISALKELAESSREIYQTFEMGSAEVESEITEQLDSLGQFDYQQDKIESLQSRIHTGRAKVQALSARVETVRERVEGWERADQEWQNKTRKRLTVVWTIIFIILVAIIGLFMALKPRNTWAPSDAVSGPDTLMAPYVPPPFAQPDMLTDVTPVREKADTSILWTKPMETEDKLREFDEL